MFVNQLFHQINFRLISFLHFIVITVFILTIHLLQMIVFKLH